MTTRRTSNMFFYQAKANWFELESSPGLNPKFQGDRSNPAPPPPYLHTSLSQHPCYRRLRQGVWSTLKWAGVMRGLFLIPFCFVRWVYETWLDIYRISSVILMHPQGTYCRWELTRIFLRSALDMTTTNGLENSMTLPNLLITA